MPPTGKAKKSSKRQRNHKVSAGERRSSRPVALSVLEKALLGPSTGLVRVSATAAKRAART